jgi:hypothetical protein
VTDKDNSDTEIDSGTDTEDVESFMPNFVPYCTGKWTDVFEIECSVKFFHPAYPLLATSHGMFIV